MSFETTPVGGSVYAPANVVAAWIEDADGNFVKTIGRYSLVRTIHLVAWSEASPAGDEDAVSGATRLDHTTALSMDWGMRVNGEPVPEGIYTVRIEVADDNSVSADENHQASFTFEHNGTAATETIDAPGFNNLTFTYDPTAGGNGNGNGNGNGDGNGDGNGNGDGSGDDGGVAVGACSAGGSSGGALALLLAVALVAFRRRRETLGS